jgi:hypothetical protein
MAGTINVGSIQVGGLKELKAELRAVRDELLNATDPERMKELAEAAGELKDRIGDANEQINVFASGSKFEQVSNSFGSLKDSIMNLDFEEAAEKAETFRQTVTSISPETISKGMTGLASTVSTLGKTFIQFGVMLLTNPIFLLVTAIVAIVAAIGALMNALGILQPILDAVGAVFGFVGDIINTVIDGIKEFLSWFGLSEGAAEEGESNAEDRHDAEMARSAERLAALDLRATKEQNAYQRAIDLAKAEGKDVTELERKKIQASINYQKEKIKELRLAIEMNKQTLYEMDLRGSISGDYELYNKALKKNNELVTDLESTKEGLLDSENALKIADIESTKTQVENSKKRAEAAAEEAEKRKEALEKIKEIQDKFAYDQMSERKQELADIDANYKEAFQLAKKYGQDTSKLLANYNAERKAVNDEFDKEELEKQQQQQEAIATLQRELNYKTLSETDLARQVERDGLTEWYSQKYELAKDDAELTKQLKEQQLLDEQALTEKYAKEDAAKVAAYNQSLKDLRTELNQVGLSDEEIARQNERLALEKWYAEKLELAKLDAEAQAEVKSAYIAKSQALDEQDKQKAIQNAIDKSNQVAEWTTQGLQVINDVVGAFAKDNEKAQERAFKVNKAANIAMAVIDTLKGAVSAYTSQIIPGDPTSIVRGAIAAAMVTAAGVANIKKIASTQFQGASASNAQGGGGTGGGGGLQPATPQTNLFGGGNDMNTLQGAQSVESKQQVVRAVVVESDITSSQSRIKRMEENATL